MTKTDTRRGEPALNYFGSKASSAPRYPAPRHRLIVEPFAGGAGYSLLHRERNVRLYDLSSHVIAAWRFLIRASAAQVRRLPLLEVGESALDLDVDEDARELIRFCVQFAPGPRNTISGFAAKHIGTAYVWGERRRERLARLASAIGHWRAECRDYRTLPNVRATWFVDPPYQRAGKNYDFAQAQRKGYTARGKFEPAVIDYRELAKWCRSRKGQVIVCENEGADWLPFKPLIRDKPGITRDGKKARRKTEVVWSRE